MSADKIKKMFGDLSAEEQSSLLFDLYKSSKKIATTNEAADTSEISKFATRHQKEYQKDIEFTVHPKEEGATLISVTLQTVFGKFKGVGTNQKIAKVNAVRMALEAWD